jgi:hypothetical protein
MDVTGFAIGKTKSHQVMVVKGGRGKAFKASLGQQEWISSIECLTAAGRVLPPRIQCPMEAYQLPLDFRLGLEDQC